MKNIQEIFDRIQEKKREQREINSSYRDALRNSVEYREVVDKLDTLKMKKRQIENALRDQVSTQLDTLKLGIKADLETLSDVAFNSLLKGEMVAVTDQYQNKYEPVFSVRFKKAG